MSHVHLHVALRFILCKDVLSSYHGKCVFNDFGFTTVWMGTTRVVLPKLPLDLKPTVQIFPLQISFCLKNLTVKKFGLLDLDLTYSLGRTALFSSRPSCIESKSVFNHTYTFDTTKHNLKK